MEKPNTIRPTQETSEIIIQKCGAEKIYLYLDNIIRIIIICFDVVVIS